MPPRINFERSGAAHHAVTLKNVRHAAARSPMRHGNENTSARESLVWLRDAIPPPGPGPCRGQHQHQNEQQSFLQISLANPKRTCFTSRLAWPVPAAAGPGILSRSKPQLVRPHPSFRFLFFVFCRARRESSCLGAPRATAPPPSSSGARPPFRQVDQAACGRAGRTAPLLRPYLRVFHRDATGVLLQFVARRAHARLPATAACLRCGLCDSESPRAAPPPPLEPQSPSQSWRAHNPAPECVPACVAPCPSSLPNASTREYRPFQYTGKQF